MRASLFLVAELRCTSALSRRSGPSATIYHAIHF